MANNLFLTITTMVEQALKSSSNRLPAATVPADLADLLQNLHNKANFLGAEGNNPVAWLSGLDEWTKLLTELAIKTFGSFNAMLTAALIEAFPRTTAYLSLFNIIRANELTGRPEINWDRLSSFLENPALFIDENLLQALADDQNLSVQGHTLAALFALAFLMPRTIHALHNDRLKVKWLSRDQAQNPAFENFLQKTKGWYSFTIPVPALVIFSKPGDDAWANDNIPATP